MKGILKKLGYTSSSVKKNPDDIKLELLFINNPDHSIRWVWNATCNQPLFLKFYNIGSYRALAFATAIRLVFILKLQKNIFRKETFFFSNVASPIFDCTKDWTIFMGTIGLNNKALLYSNNCFYKIATTESSQKMIATEYDVLRKINLQEKNFITPRVTYISKNSIRLTDISSKGRRTKTFTPAHLDTLVAMSTMQPKTIEIAQWPLFDTLKLAFKKIDDNRIPKNIIRKLNTLIETDFENTTIETCLSQGDFTQWNMYESNKKIAVYDWELASFERPKGFDYFHYIMQQGILVERKSWSLIYDTILKSSKNGTTDRLFSTHPNDYLKWYLILNCMYNLNLYANHPKWYPQVYWSLEVWNQALNVFLEKVYTQRQLLIMDVFDLLYQHDYAALKYPNGNPEDLSIHSDIDLVLDKKLNKTIIKYLKNHALVSKITIKKLSFMNTIQVFMPEGSILSLDLIWQLKRKNLEILSTNQIIAHNYNTHFGVKSASEIDTARFIILFYALNGAEMPEKYLPYKQAIKNSDDTLDLILQDYFDTKKKDCFFIEYFIKEKKENNNYSYFKNSVNYGIDTLKNSIRGKGFIITFSGVDGAGKSTIIEQLAHRIEKQLRKPVIVLRHRPSILPILSVWTKGKQKAHQDAVNNLPRQGVNINFTSSLFRFSYYYLDYLIGQFVIYFKYILRGYVVIYDRYYFDFINDSKRSNIVMSKNISSFGYQFLLKPKFNFFLFADAATILNRKKELSKTTIEQLTNDYKNLFKALKSKSQFAVYESINNEDIEVTLNRVLTTIIQTKR